MLANFIDKAGVVVMNNSQGTYGSDVIAGAGGFLYSDSDAGDAALIVRIPFTERVSLSGFIIEAKEKPEVKECDNAMPPQNVKLFTSPMNMSFDEYEEKMGVQEFKLSVDQTSGMPISVKPGKFNNIVCLTFFLQSNQDETDVTFLNKITLKGKSVKIKSKAELEKNSQNPVCVQIRAGLWLGNNKAASDKDLLKSCKITHCLGITTAKVDYPDQLLKVDKLPIKDDPNERIDKIFDQSREFIISALIADENQVLIHCTDGISSSVTIICSYLMATERKSANEALTYVKSKRPEANPNFGFWKQLRNLEEGLIRPSDLSID